MNKKGFTTSVLHTPYAKKDVHGSLRMPIYEAAAFEFEKAEDIGDAFSGARPSHVYSRGSNPTVTHLEQTIQQVTNAKGVIAMASGMAAISNSFVAILQPGENVIVSSRLFGNTFGLFKETLADLGFEFRFADLNHPEEVEAKVDDKTRAIFVETITNPLCEVASVHELSRIAGKHNLVLVADTTMSPLLLFDAKSHGVHIEIISSTKFISGGATSVGGLLIDHGTFDWAKVPKLTPHAEKFGDMALIAKLKKEIYRNFGSCMSPNNAYLQSLGMETFELRVFRACYNTMKVARWLESHPKVKRVLFPGLEDSPYHKIAQSQFPNGFGALLSFELDSEENCMKMQNELQIIRRATNLNDNKTLIIHPASTIYVEFSEEEKHFQGITNELIRLAVGIEEADDLIADLEQALGKI